MRQLDPQNRKSPTVSLLSHIEEGLSAQQSVDKIADFFAAISGELEPITIEKLSPKLREKLKMKQNVPIIEDHEVFEKIKRAKKPNSSVPRDIPKKVMIEFAAEYSKPAAKNMNLITQTGSYPRQWVREYQMAIVKKKPALDGCEFFEANFFY